VSESSDVPLSLATFEDIIAEVERRGVACALVVSHVSGRHYIPCPDVPPADREKVYGDAPCRTHPVWTACFLLRGVQWCLSECEDLDTALLVDVSGYVNEVSKVLFRAWQESQGEEPDEP
jgi:hypothetical protein